MTLQVNVPRHKALGKNTQLLIRPKLGWDNRQMTASERIKTMQSSPVAHLGIVSLPVVIAGIGYLAGYVLLDWISFIEPYGPVSITTWNPGTGLSLAFGLLFGRRVIPLLFIAPLISDLILNQSPVPWSVELSFVAIIGSGYSAALVFLLRPSLQFDPALSSMRDLILLMLVAVFSTAFVASGYVAATILAGLLSPNEFAAAAFRYWVGDMIGIMVAPFAVSLQLAVSPPTSSHETYRRGTVEQGNRNAAQLKCENRRQPSSLGYGTNWRAKSCGTCADGDNHPGAAIERNLGSRLIKSTIQGRRRGRQRLSSFEPACRIVWRCA